MAARVRTCALCAFWTFGGLGSLSMPEAMTHRARSALLPCHGGEPSRASSSPHAPAATELTPHPPPPAQVKRATVTPMYWGQLMFLKYR